jgi:hypothetical protein
MAFCAFIQMSALLLNLMVLSIAIRAAHALLAHPAARWLRRHLPLPESLLQGQPTRSKTIAFIILYDSSSKFLPTNRTWLQEWYHSGNNMQYASMGGLFFIFMVPFKLDSCS